MYTNDHTFSYSCMHSHTNWQTSTDALKNMPTHIYAQTHVCMYHHALGSYIFTDMYTHGTRILIYISLYKHFCTTLKYTRTFTYLYIHIYNTRTHATVN